MAQKNNIRSIRFSDELADLIDRQVGDTFTAKFENLITRCVWELPEAEKKLKELRKEIQKEQERLQNYKWSFQRFEEISRSIERQQNDYLNLLRKTESRLEDIIK